MTPFFHSHVPKAAGWGFSSILEKLCHKVYLDNQYQDPEAVLTPNATVIEGIKGLVSNGFLVGVRGHVPVSVYADVFDEVNICLWVREQGQRLASQYAYDERTTSGGSLGAKVRCGELSRLEYFQHPFLVNLQSRYADIPLERIKFLGVVERFDASIELFRRMFELEFEHPGRWNFNERLLESPVSPEPLSHQDSLKGIGSSAYELTGEEQGCVRQVHKDDCALYSEVMGRHLVQCRKYGVST